MTAHQTDHPPCTACYSYRGCRCDECSREMRRYHKRWQVERLAGRRRLVDAGPARERVEMLLQYGMTVKGIARDAGLGQASVRDLVHPRPSGRMTTKILRRTEEAILAVRFRPGKRGTVPAAGACRRLRDLALRGYGLPELSAVTGVREDTLARVRTGRRAFVSSALADAVRAAHSDLHLRRPEQTVGYQQGRIRRLAERKGWVPLAKYDDPDNPLEVRRVLAS